MKIALGSDHAGYEAKISLREHLCQQGHECLDLGTDGESSCDYPDYAAAVGRAVSLGKVDRGVLVCGTGIGMSISANKVDGVRAALCHDEQTARMSREHNDANVLCLGARILGEGQSLKIVDSWLVASFAGDRHARRVLKISALEKRD